MIDTAALRSKIIDLAIQGKLTEQLPTDGTAEELYQQIQAEKNQLIKDKKIKKEKPLPEITADEIPFEIPDNWKWVRIGEIFQLHAGKNVKANCISNRANEEHRYLCYGGNGIRGYVADYNCDGVYPLIGRQGALCGNVHLAEGKFYATEHAVVTDTFANTDTKWAENFLKALNLNQYATATAQPGLAVNKIEQVLIPLPPLSEQKRIVAKIEEVLAEIKIIDELQSKYASNVDVLKSKIIDAGIRGQLTEQLPEDGTAEDLYQAIQSEKTQLIKEKKIKKEKPLPEITADEIPFEIPENWKWVRWGDISQSIQYGYNAPALENGRIKMVRISDIQSNEVLWEDVPYCDIDEDSIETYLLQPNDILFARTGGTVGKSYLVEEVPEEAVYAGYLIRTRYSRLLSPRYLKYFMQGSLYWSQLRNGTIATAQPNCNGKTLGKMIVPLPPLSEQKRIVAKIDEVFSALDKRDEL